MAVLPVTTHAEPLRGLHLATLTEYHPEVYLVVCICRLFSRSWSACISWCFAWNALIKKTRGCFLSIFRTEMMSGALGCATSSVGFGSYEFTPSTSKTHSSPAPSLILTSAVLLLGTWARSSGHCGSRLR